MTKRLKTIIIAVLIAAFSTISAVAQSVSLQVNPQAIQGQRFAVTVVINDGDTRLTRNDAPQLEGCTLLGEPGRTTMQSIQIVNGRQSASTGVNYTFTYLADKAGTVTIPPIKVNVDGKSLQTQQRTITILPPDQANQRRGSSGYGYGSAIDEMEELMNELMGGSPSRPRQQQQQQAPQQSKFNPSDFLVVVSLSKSNIYEKEAVIATIKLYSKHDITRFQPVVMPQFEGFLSEEIDVSDQTPQQEHYNGQNYYSLVLKKCLLYPQRAGRLTINSGTYDVSLRTVDYISYGFYSTPIYNEHNITTKSNSLTVNVKPLPIPIPPSFNGAVGDFDISTSLTPEQLRTNEAAKYVLTVSGIGNLTHLGEPIINFPATVEEYTPTGETDARFNGSNMQGKYTATYTFVPQEVGTLKINSWDFTYFNPSTGKYVTVTLPEYTRNVARGIATSAPVSSSANIDVSKIRDIRHIHKVNPDELSMTPRHLFRSAWYLPAYLIAIALLVAALIVYRRHIKAAADVQGRKIKKARSVAAKRLQKARQAMQAHRSEEFYAALSAALWGFLSDKLKMPASSLTRDNVAGTLEQAGANSELVNKTITLLDECEMARFTPSHSDSEMSTLYTEASEIIDTLNRLKPQSSDNKAQITTRSRYSS